MSKVIHTNLLIVWVLTGFMGAPTGWFLRSRGPSCYSPRMAYAALTAPGRRDGGDRVVGYLFGWTAGNKLLEQPLPVKLAIVWSC